MLIQGARVLCPETFSMSCLKLMLCIFAYMAAPGYCLISITILLFIAIVRIVIVVCCSGAKIQYCPLTTKYFVYFNKNKYYGIYQKCDWLNTDFADLANAMRVG